MILDNILMTIHHLHYMSYYLKYNVVVVVVVVGSLAAAAAAGAAAGRSIAVFVMMRSMMNVSPDNEMDHNSLDILGKY